MEKQTYIWESEHDTFDNIILTLSREEFEKINTLMARNGYKLKK